ncbi:MAG: hypothetical protein ACREEM_20920 [Blastocatellia bacterium]
MTDFWGMRPSATRSKPPCRSNWSGAAHERGYVRTPEGFEVDFLATPITGKPTLIRVSRRPGRPSHARAGVAAPSKPRACCIAASRALLLTLATAAAAARSRSAQGVRVQAAWEWLLMNEE